MDAGLMAVLALLGAVLLVPLALAWVSTNPRRWSRVEGVLGREPKARPYPPRWLPWALIGGGAGYLASAIAMARDRDTPSLFLFWALTGAGYVLAGVIHLVAQWRQKQKAALGQPQVRDRAEPGKPL
jgi:drug/metabolite transporter (DMT)-like permease